MSCPSTRALILFVLITYTVSGCQESSSRAASPSTSAAPTRSFDEVIETKSAIHIDETSGEVLVSPNVYWESDGFLVADSEESRIFRFDTAGQLEWTSGGKGPGPGEYRSAVEVVRLRSGKVLAADWKYKFVLLSPAGDSVIRTIPTEFNRLESMQVLSDSTLLVTSAPDDTLSTAYAFVWNLSGDSVSRSFFHPTYPDPIVRNTAGWTVADVRGDTVALAYSLKDTVFLYSSSGNPLGSVPIHSSHFRPVQPLPPSAMEDPQARMEWISSFDLVNSVNILSDGGYLVSYRSMDKGGIQHHYVRIGATGDPYWEIRDVGRLLYVSDSDQVLMVAPDALVPNQWLIGTLR